MDEEHLSEEIKRALRDVRLKKPSEEFMSDFEGGVQRKIDQAQAGPMLGLTQLGGAVLVAALVIGLVYFFMVRPVNREKPVGSFKEVTVEDSGAAAFSAEEQIAILEAFDQDIESETIDLMDSEQLVEEFAFMDEFDFNLLEGGFPPSVV